MWVVLQTTQLVIRVRGRENYRRYDVILDSSLTTVNFSTILQETNDLARFFFGIFSFFLQLQKKGEKKNLQLQKTKTIHENICNYKKEKKNLQSLEKRRPYENKQVIPENIYR